MPTATGPLAGRGTRARKCTRIYGEDKDRRSSGAEQYRSMARSMRQAEQVSARLVQLLWLRLAGQGMDQELIDALTQQHIGPHDPNIELALAAGEASQV